MGSGASASTLHMDQVSPLHSDGQHRSIENSRHALNHDWKSPLGLSGQDAARRNSSYRDEIRQVSAGALSGSAAIGRYGSEQQDASTVPQINGLADPVMRTVVSSDKDALNLLFGTARQQDDSNGDQQYMHSRGAAVGAVPATGEASQDTPGPLSSIYTAAASPHPITLPNASSNVLDVWDASRFVKMGWFSAKEAVLFVDL
jgi:hypothetical protein